MTYWLFDKSDSHYIHIADTPAGKALWAFIPGKLSARVRNPFKLSEVNEIGNDIFIMFKASTQQGIIA